MSQQSVKQMPSRIVIRQGDLTEMETDAIVNAANNDLILGAGVAGAIRRKGGKRSSRSAMRFGSIPIGLPRLPGAANLKARYVIHAASMGLGSLTTRGVAARVHGACTAAGGRARSEDDCVSGGWHGDRGISDEGMREIMLHEAAEHLRNGSSLETIYFVLFDEEATKSSSAFGSACSPDRTNPRCANYQPAQRQMSLRSAGFFQNTRVSHNGAWIRVDVGWRSWRVPSPLFS